MIRIGSLFSGIGGLELGLERGLRRAGIPTVTSWQVERDEYARKVLSKHWPDAIRFEDVRKVGADLPPADIICGGFPCQDISVAGKQAGITESTRSGLFYELARIVGLVRPRYVVLENVAAITASNGGADLGAVLGQLATLGYDAWWDCIPASAIGAPHRRDRWFAVCWDVANPERGAGQQRGLASGVGREQQQDPALRSRACARAALPRVGGDADGVSAGLDRHQWPVGPNERQPATEPPRTHERRCSDKERLRALGNAVVPQVAEVIAAFVAEHIRRFSD